MDIDFTKLIEYSPSTGVLCWRVRVGSRGLVGKEIGHMTTEGYRRVKIAGRMYLVHRLAWLLSYGAWPQHEIDHINGNRQDNRLVNLRNVSKTLNQRNAVKRTDNSSGIVGVREIYYPTKYWVAQWMDGKRKNKWFSVKKYGEKKAKKLAIQCRVKRIAELGGYTKRHGL
jgi:hypothetical protein